MTELGSRTGALPVVIECGKEEERDLGSLPEDRVQYVKYIIFDPFFVSNMFSVVKVILHCIPLFTLQKVQFNKKEKKKKKKKRERCHSNIVKCNISTFFLSF